MRRLWGGSRLPRTAPVTTRLAAAFLARRRGDGSRPGSWAGGLGGSEGRPMRQLIGVSAGLGRCFGAARRQVGRPQGTLGGARGGLWGDGGRPFCLFPRRPVLALRAARPVVGRAPRAASGGVHGEVVPALFSGRRVAEFWRRAAPRRLLAERRGRLMEGAYGGVVDALFASRHAAAFWHRAASRRPLAECRGRLLREPYGGVVAAFFVARRAAAFWHHDALLPLPLGGVAWLSGRGIRSSS